MRRLACLSVFAAVVLASCSTGSGDSDSSGRDALDVGIIPIVAVAPLAIGIEKGYFEDEGLDVEYHIAQGGAALVPAVASGQYDVAFSNNVSLIIARAKGLPLRIVSAANSAGEDPKPIEEALVAPSGGAVKEVADLEGKTVAVNTLNNIVELANRKTLEKAGVDPDTVEFVEIGFPDMPLALEQGRVDAADIAEPFLTQAKAEGAKVIAHPFRDVQPDLFISSWFATEEFMESNPETVESFTRALDRAKQYATKHPEEVRALIPDLLSIDKKLAQDMALAYWPKGLPSEKSLEILYESSVEYGIVDPDDLSDPNVLLGHGQAK